MTFGDRFVLWLYASMAETLPVGRDALDRLLDLAFQRGRLAPALLNDLSILLILAASPAGSPLRIAKEQEEQRRRLVRHPQRMLQLLQAIRPPHVAAFLDIGRPQPLLRGVVAQGLLGTELFPNLCTFMGRMFLRNPEEERTRARQFLVQATGLYYGFSQGTMDYSCGLYRHVLPRLRPDDEALPAVFPAGPQPAWFTDLDADEQQFLGRCLTLLPEPALERLYLQF
jgi:hypothetical protein